MKHDFSGWATKNDLVCNDGAIIRHGAFSKDDGKTVPLVWMHNYDNVSNVLGHVKLEARDQGVYAYGYFNDSDYGQSAKSLVQHGDINSLSIAARRVKKMGDNVMSGSIYEVSLVLAGANPGAVIEHSIAHSDGGEESVIIHVGEEFQNEKEDAEMHKGETLLHSDDATVEEVLETLNDEQVKAVEFLLDGMASAIMEGLEENDEGEESMKHNLFESGSDVSSSYTADDFNEVLQHSISIGSNSLMGELKHALGEAATYGISNIGVLFPEAKDVNGGAPTIWKDEMTRYAQILAGTRKSPFMKLKNTHADLTEDEARARGYIKGEEKLEQVFRVFTRETDGQTIYKKQRLDRDDIIDITDFNVVRFIEAEMRMKLEEELARAILVGDGRKDTDASKIRTDRIRPIIGDVDLFTIKKTFDSSQDMGQLFELVIDAMIDYKGSGQPSMYIDPRLVGKLRLLRDEQGRWLFGNRPASLGELADVFGVKEIVPTSFMTGKGFVLVNLADYTVGTNRGGEITNFSDFDIDFNQYKYLIETRVSGALMNPFSAVYFKDTNSSPSKATTPKLKEFFNASGVGVKNDLNLDSKVEEGIRERKQAAAGSPSGRRSD